MILLMVSLKTISIVLTIVKRLLIRYMHEYYGQISTLKYIKVDIPDSIKSLNIKLIYGKSL